MGKATNNEFSVLECLEECVPPNIFFQTFGGNASNVPDIIAADINDPYLDREQVTKAHYIIIGSKLYLHTPFVDPWNIREVYQNLDLTFEPLNDKLVQISKRPAGATRKSGSASGGALKPGDYRHVSFGLRFWIDVPEHGIDLLNPDHQNALSQTLKRIGHHQYVPYATFDAKTDEKTQFIGPSLTVNRDENRSLSLAMPDLGLFQGSLAEDLGKVLFTGDMAVKIHNYFDTLGTETSTFKVVADDSEDPGVPESRYKGIQFNETLELDVGLVAATSIKEVNNGISKKAPRKTKNRKQAAQETSTQS